MPDAATLAETARRVARQLTALADELHEAAPPPRPLEATLHLPEGTEVDPSALRDLQAALSRATGGSVGKITAVPAAGGTSPSEPDVRNYGLREPNT